MSKKVERIITDRIIAKLQGGTVPWQKPWNAAPSNGISRKPYKGVNRILTGMAGYESPYWLTYKQAQGLGGQVRKGEKSTPIIYWNVTEKTVKDEEEGEEKTKKIFILRYYNVFNVLQIDGLGGRFRGDGTVKIEPTEASCQAILDAYTDKPEFTTGGDSAHYAPATDIINLPARSSFKTAAGYWSTVYHECIHSTGAKHRLNRELSMAQEKYSFEELIAELGASFLNRRAGILEDQIDQHAAYIDSWIKALDSHPDWIIKAAAKAEKAADYIDGEIEEADEEVA